MIFIHAPNQQLHTAPDEDGARKIIAAIVEGGGDTAQIDVFRGERLPFDYDDTPRITFGAPTSPTSTPNTLTPAPRKPRALKPVAPETIETVRAYLAGAPDRKGTLTSVRTGTGLAIDTAQAALRQMVASASCVLTGKTYYLAPGA